MSLETLVWLIGSVVGFSVLMLTAYCIRVAMDDWLWDLRQGRNLKALRRRKDDG